MSHRGSMTLWGYDFLENARLDPDVGLCCAFRSTKDLALGYAADDNAPSEVEVMLSGKGLSSGIVTSIGSDATKPIETAEPAERVESIEPAKSIETAEPVGSAGLVELTEPVLRVEPV